jgi:hypothetical protein
MTGSQDIRNGLETAERLIEVARQSVSQFADLVRGNQQLDKLVDHYLRTALSIPEATLNVCRDIIASNHSDARLYVPTLIDGVVASIANVHIVFAIIEHVRFSGQGATHSSVKPQQNSTEPGIVCSFCGMERPVVAGPKCFICADCTRLACRILRISLSEEPT